MAGWQFWIDRGGTFTDIVARAPDGALHTAKLLSEDPERYDDAAIAGIRRLMGVPDGAVLPQQAIASVRMGTTVATNALLERKGARTLLVVDRGFADLLRIGTQARPRLFDLDIRLPEPIHAAVEEIGGRIDVDGRTVLVLDEAETRAMLQRRRADGFDAVAIVLAHSWMHPDTETRVAALACEAGFEQVSASHGASPLVGLVARGRTTVVDAYLSPVLRAYVDRVASALGDTTLLFMQSSGGLASADRFGGKDAILSGPAGGVVAAARTAEAAGFAAVIGFDMGGTSTDVALYDGRFERVFDATVAGVEMRVPTVAIETVAAGGGSILHAGGGRFRVGPDSAGARPGPACYRNGGPLTVTDANLLTGRLDPAHFPALFGPNGDQALDGEVVRRGFAAMAADLERDNGQPTTPQAVADGFLSVAVGNMAAAIRRVALEKGRNAADFTLQCFGGAGGQLACRVAEALDMRAVLIHPMAGVLSAFGMGLADQTAIRQHSVERVLDEDAPDALRALADALGLAAEAELGAGAQRTVQVRLRYQGTDTALPVPPGDVAALRCAFEQAHRARYGFAEPGRPVVVDSVVVEATLPGAPVSLPLLEPGDGTPPAPIGNVRLWSGDHAADAPVFERAALRPGDVLDGPALIREPIATTVLESGWRLRIGAHGELLLRHVFAAARTEPDPSVADPVQLALFNTRFMGIAERMGVVLRQTASSVNMKERLDFSCALFDAEGHLVANAPHVPVHLGAMGESVRTVIRSRGATLRPGDAVALNNPFNGGTHLPDVTVISPVFDECCERIRFFVANRGHHADIGGLTPGSTPPGSRTLDDEGVVIDDFLLVSAGELRERTFRDLLQGAAHPARSPDTNLADIRAQLAANQAGIAELDALLRASGWMLMQAYMRHLRAHAEHSIRRVIGRLRDGAFTYRMDDGATLQVSIRIDQAARDAVIDFTGTGAADAGNFNAPPAVTRAAVLYAFRCLLREDLPLNEGCLAPLRIVLPPGSFLDPPPGSAVVAGNTEISQAVCNALLGALGAQAASQGTMNNLLFGNDLCQYYETICGGAGAGPGFHGASAVHTHMTNTRITDPEILEMRYPVRLDRFRVRTGSGGAGQWRGGDGVERAIVALHTLDATLVASRRTVPPFGLAGGEAGAPGSQHVQRADGTREALTGRDRTTLHPGDRLVILTPGGGGWGGSGSCVRGTGNPLACVPFGAASPKGSIMADATTPVWFISGCSTGFGHELATLVLERGWRAIVTARDAARLADLVAGREEQALAVSLDVTDQAAIDKAVSDATERFGRIDVLVNNAGYGYQATIEEGKENEIRAQFDANVFGLFALTRAVLPAMRRQRSGHVINITSVAGLVGFPGSGYYAASKHAVEGFSDALAVETAPLGIKVTCVEPGPFRTDWAGRSLKQTRSTIPDYESTAGQRMRDTAAGSGKQKGDPKRAAQAMIDITEIDQPPRHFVLGAQGHGAVLGKLKARVAEIEAWEEKGKATDFPDS